MQKRGFFSQVWDLFGPLFLEGAVGIIVIMAANTVLLLKNMEGYIKALQSGSEETLMRFINIQTEELLSYAGLITIATALCTIPVMLFLIWRDKKKNRLAGLPRGERVPWGNMWAVVPFAAAVGIGLNNILILSNLPAVSQGYAEVSGDLYSMPFYLQMVGYGLITPLCEELMFRAVIFRRLRTGMSFQRAMVLSALMFGLYHGNLVQFLYAFLLGLLFAYLYEKYHTLAAPVLAHMIANLASVILTKASVFTWMFEDPVRMGIITVICAAAGSTMFVVISGMFRKNEFQGPAGKTE